MFITSLALAATLAAPVPLEDDLVRVDLEPCALTAQRPPSMKSLLNRTIKVSRRGHIAVGGERFDVFLPHVRDFPLNNSKPGDDSFTNTAGYFYIDQNRDGVLTVDESWFANVPVRIGDTMFEVAELDDKRGWLDLRRTANPVTGSVIGRAAPPFDLKTVTNDRVTNDTYAGAFLLIDIWSPS